MWLMTVCITNTKEICLFVVILVPVLVFCSENEKSCLVFFALMAGHHILMQIQVKIVPVVMAQLLKNELDRLDYLTQNLPEPLNFSSRNHGRDNPDLENFGRTVSY